MAVGPAAIGAGRPHCPRTTRRCLRQHIEISTSGTPLPASLRAVPKLDLEKVLRLISDLNSEKPDKLDAAAKELARLGLLVESDLRAALAAKEVPLRSKERITDLLRVLDDKRFSLTGEDKLHLRAIQALERIGTKQARQLLEQVAQGPETSARTRAAANALL